MFSSTVLLSGLVASVLAAPALEPRAGSCTFTDAATAIKNKASCSTIILNNIAVPAKTILDLTKLNDGTHVS